MKWYVVHTYASHEFKIKDAILKGIKGNALEDKIGQILIPTQKTFHIREGKRVEREKKLFNSYVILQADLTPQVYSYIIGINRLLGISDREKDEVKSYEFLPGDIVKIASGPFNDFEGVIEKISEDKQKLTVKVTVFGRITPVEVKSDQVEIM